VLIAVATKKQRLPIENEIKYREKTVTPSFKITLYIYIYIPQTRLTRMKSPELRKVSNNLKSENRQIMYHKDLTK